MVSTINYLKALEILNICRKYEKEKTRFGYACMRNKDILESDGTIKKLEKEIERKRNNLQSTNDKGYLAFNEDGSPAFTEENLNKLTDFTDYLYHNTDNKNPIKIEFYKCQDITSIKDNLPLLVKLNGTVVDVDIEALYGEEKKSVEVTSNNRKIVKKK